MANGTKSITLIHTPLAIWPTVQVLRWQSFYWTVTVYEKAGVAMPILLISDYTVPELKYNGMLLS